MSRRREPARREPAHKRGAGLLSLIGPGVITGAADDDPSGIATYSQAGAQFGLDMLWTMPVSYPMMSAVQSLCGRIGRVTGRGLAANIKHFFPAWVLFAAVGLLLLANTFNIAADVASMGNVLALAAGGNPDDSSMLLRRHLLTALLVVISLLLQILIPYRRYVWYLRWLTLTLLSYAAVLFCVHVPWTHVALRTLLPTLPLNASTATVVLGVLGTTISPYLFFWQCSQELEDLRVHRARALREDPAAAPAELRRIRWDTWGGMLYSNLAGYFIILSTAITLHTAGVTDVKTAAQAALALRPLAGDMAFDLFAVGIVGVGLISVPVLAGSAGYALAEAMGWRWGLGREALKAWRFYAVISATMLGGLLMDFSSINPIKALFYSAVINGVVAVPLIVLILMLASRREVMGRFTASRRILTVGWITAVVMAAAVAGMLIPA